MCRCKGIKPVSYFRCEFTILTSSMGSSTKLSSELRLLWLWLENDLGIADHCRCFTPIFQCRDPCKVTDPCPYSCSNLQACILKPCAAHGYTLGEYTLTFLIFQLNGIPVEVNQPLWSLAYLSPAILLLLNQCAH